MSVRQDVIRTVPFTFELSLTVNLNDIFPPTIMKLWCLLLVFLISISSTSSWHLPDDRDALLNYSDLEHFSSVPIEHRRSIIVKRSQRNANILYRYCRRTGHPPQFCLNYAVRMIFATGH